MKKKFESMEKRLELMLSKMNPVEILLMAVTIGLVMALVTLIIVIKVFF